MKYCILIFGGISRIKSGISTLQYCRVAFERRGVATSEITVRLDTEQVLVMLERFQKQDAKIEELEKRLVELERWQQAADERAMGDDL